MLLAAAALPGGMLEDMFPAARLAAERAKRSGLNQTFGGRSVGVTEEEEEEAKK